MQSYQDLKTRTRDESASQFLSQVPMSSTHPTSRILTTVVSALMSVDVLIVVFARVGAMRAIGAMGGLPSAFLTPVPLEVQTFLYAGMPEAPAID